jgi:uncharacterized phiE125 gp8 family phage protein
MTLRVVVKPSSPNLISLDEAKAQLRLQDVDDDDALITRLIGVASRTVETHVQRRYFAQTLEWVCETWPSGKPFPIAGVNGSVGMAVESITYVDTLGEQQTLDPSQYWVRPAGETIKIVPRWFVIWPWLGDGAERVVVRFTVPDPDDRTDEDSGAPDGAKQAACLLVSHWHAHPDAVVGVENRDSSSEMPLGVDAALWTECWSETPC